MSDTGSEADELPLDEEEEEAVEEEPTVYYSEDFISGPFLSEESTVPLNILEFDYSFGYDCKRHYNLTVADENTLIFASGNLINFLNVETKQFTFRRSAFGGGIGHITKNPNSEFSHIAIGENGIKPPIIIYEWPSLDIVCLLKEGTSRSYTHLNYSPDGMLLVSQGGEPDFLITIFNWPRSTIMLRTKSNVNEVYRVMFAPEVPGQLTSCGLTHIKFWKTAQTFTGLKLQGELGRFGKTEYCDILGIYPMPDEKVVSGTSWGNILVWDEGLIKVEVCRKLRKRCHDAPISQFHYSNGELWSVGQDGRIRVWFYDTIDQSDPPDDDRVVQIQPIYDFHTPGVMFMCIYEQNNKPKNSLYYAQDGNGGLWRVDLNTDRESGPPEQLYKCHAGPIADIAACPWGPLLATLGVDGRLHLYHYMNQKLLFIHQYAAKGAAMIWLPMKLQPSGDQVIMGFDDGNIRVAVLTLPEDLIKIKITTIQITKPHNRAITKININDEGTVLVSGSEDATIFVYQIITEQHQYAVLVPIGYIPVPGTVTCLTWLHEHETVIIVGCIHGHLLEVEVPTVPQAYTTISYKLDATPIHQRFTTYKAQIRRDIYITTIEARKALKLEKKREDMEKVKADNPGLDIDEEVFLADSESEEELEPLHIPEIPNPILWIKCTPDDTLWLSMGGYDAGYIYEYRMDQTIDIPYRFQIIYDGDDTEISTYTYNSNKEYLIMAMQNGAIRVVKVNPDDWRDLSNYWQLSMHDNYNGFIPRMCFSYNEKYFFTCGHDGNIFSFKFYTEENNYIKIIRTRQRLQKLLIAASDHDGYKTLSLEETIVKAEYDRQQRVANDHKKILLDKLKILKERFEKLIKRNEKLPPTQVISREEFEIDPRITLDLEERLTADLALVKRKLAYHVEKSEVAMIKLRTHFTDAVDIFPICVKGIQRRINVKNGRQRKLAKIFSGMLELVEQKIIEAEVKGRYKVRILLNKYFDDKQMLL